MSPELAGEIARAIAASAAAVLLQREVPDPSGALAREIGRNAAQGVVLLLDAHEREEAGVKRPCWRCGFAVGTDGVNEQCRPCYDREIRREKDEERAR